jgi:hypothetical protein
MGLVPADWPGAWPGIVLSRRFVGAVYAYRVAVADDRVFEVLAPDKLAEEGDRVSVRILRQQVALVCDDGPPAAARPGTPNPGGAFASVAVRSRRTGGVRGG